MPVTYTPVSLGTGENTKDGAKARSAFEIINENFAAVVAGIPNVGESGVQSVNGVIPNELGVVTLTAADVGAEPAGSGSDVFSNLNTLT